MEDFLADPGNGLSVSQRDDIREKAPYLLGPIDFDDFIEICNNEHLTGQNIVNRMKAIGHEYNVKIRQSGGG